MKKIILSAAIVALGFVAVSCSKEYTCQCNTYTSTSVAPQYNTTQSNTSNFTTIKKGETDAATQCNTLSVSTTTTVAGSSASNYTYTSTYTDCGLQPTLE